MSATGDQLRAHFAVDADRVAPKLYIGAYDGDEERLARAGFGKVIRVAQELPGARLGFDDVVPVTAETVDRAMRAAAEATTALNAGRRTLIQCAMGVNRSAFVAAAVMIKRNGMAPADAIAEIRNQRVVRPPMPHALTNMGFVQVLLGMRAGGK